MPATQETNDSPRHSSFMHVAQLGTLRHRERRWKGNSTRMIQPHPFPTVSAAGFRAYIDLIAYESTTWAALIHALSLFGHKTAVDAIRARLRMGESATLTLPEAMTGRLVLPDTVVSRT